MLINDLKTIKATEQSILDILIGDISLRIEPISRTSPIMEAFLRFMKDEKLSLIPVLDGNLVIGQLHRSRFLEHTVLGKYGYGIHLNAKKSIFEVMEKPNFIFDYDTTLEDASMLIQKRELKHLYDDIIITKNGEYYGIVPVNLLLEAITQKSIILAKDANPLTGLPGNWAIQREIEKRIRDKEEFDVCYIDINHFKPYNDCYGFEKGDKVISCIGSILKNTEKEFANIFVGHIGGDDFIIIAPPEVSQFICERVVKAFEEYLPAFHREDFINGYYISKNRKNEEEVFKLLSLTCAIVSNVGKNITSYAHLASLASEVKAEAKRLSRVSNNSVIFRDRRNG